MDYLKLIKKAASEGFRFTVRFDDGEWISSPEGEKITDVAEVVASVKAVEQAFVRLYAPEGHELASNPKDCYVGCYVIMAYGVDVDESIVDYSVNQTWIEDHSWIDCI